MVIDISPGAWTTRNSANEIPPRGCSPTQRLTCAQQISSAYNLARCVGDDDDDDDDDRLGAVASSP